ncbi:MAG TPA: N-6 DNA methylase [Candidatus Bathyarchaeia archaeon]|nr:N-6 DNA methylase [Candidatus Bathyarchaeia archaeon]
MWLMENGQAKEKVQQLVERYNSIVREGRKSQYSEADVGSKFILPLLGALGWDTTKIEDVKEQRRTLTGVADYSLLNVGSASKIFLEIKKFDEDLDGFRRVGGKVKSFPQITIDYAWQSRADWAVLTNFEEVRLYYSRVKKPQDGLIFKLRYNDYVATFAKLWLLSKESAVSGLLDTYEKRRLRRDIDEELLKDLVYSRKLLVSNVRKNHPQLPKDEVNEATQKILDRLMFIRSCEDRRIIPAESLWIQFSVWQKIAIDKTVRTFMMDLKNIFRDFDAVYNGKLFAPHLCEDLRVDNEVLEAILTSLYNYNFDLIPVDVLGNAYELYIGTIVKEKEGTLREDELTLVEDPTVRKKHGIYYTPEYVVDYIVRNTLGKMLEKCKTVEDVSKIKVLDPACGSGSFLIKAFDAIKEWYDHYNKRNKLAATPNTLDAHFQAIPNVEEKILTENLYGVDVDPQAVEITILNLSLKAVKTKQRLPHMGDHIRCGNSLIDDETVAYSKAFKWKEEFKEILDNGGFDVVIGNPPYVRVQQLKYEEIDFFKAHYNVAHERIDISLMFFELASKLIRSDGKIGFISSSQFTTAEYGRNLRKLLLSRRMEKFVDFGSLPVFEDAITYSVIIIFSNNMPAPFYYYKLTQLDSIRKNLISILEEGTQSIIKLKVHPETLGEEVWNFASQEEHEIISKIRKRENTALLGSFANPSTGITTGCDQILLLNDKKIAQNQLEKDGLIRTLRGRNIEPWIIKGPYDYVIYPYKIEEKDNALLSYEEMKQKYPNMHDYLLKNKERLTKRRDSRKEVAETKEWYGLIRKGKIELFKSPKIVTPALTKHNSFALDEDGSAFLTGGAGVFAIMQEKVDPRYLLAILNSKLIEFFLHRISTKKQGGYYSYLHTFLAQIPIVMLEKESQKPFIEKATDVISKIQKYYMKLNKFYNRLLERFTNIKITKKLASFYEMDFPAFTKEVYRAGNVKLPLKEADEWEDYFNTYKNETIELLDEISKTKNEINSMVFDLYNLSEVERQIVIKKIQCE